MNFAIISDIHSNIEALTSIFLAISNDNEKVDKFLVTGDMVGYGPNPNECCFVIQFLQKGGVQNRLKVKEIVDGIDITDNDKTTITDYIISMANTAIVIAGNHDKEVIGQPSLVSSMSGAASKAATWTKGVLEKGNFKFLSSLGYKKKLSKFGIELVHSTPVYPQGWEYPKNASVLNYSSLFSRITFAGHTHSPSAYLYNNLSKDETPSVFIPVDQFDNRLMLIERESYERIETFDILPEKNHKYYINPGSVGQPRDGIPKASYMIYDTETKQIALKKAEFNTEAVKDKIIKAKLPRELANRVLKGN